MPFISNLKRRKRLQAFMFSLFKGAALINIGATGQASIDAVAGPVGEALIMTALGLLTAIPALLAYNFFSRTNAATNARFDTFAHDLHDFFATGARVR